MRNKLVLLTSGVTVLLLLLFSLNLAQATAVATVDWWTIGAGGGGSSAGGVSLNGTIGQPLVGRGLAGNIEVCSGFWECGGTLAAAPTAGVIYLPVVLKQ